MGGRIQRSTTPASYAVGSPRTLDDLSASGSFAVTASQGGAGVFFGFFNSHQPGGSGRPIGSLGLDFDFEGTGGRLAVRLITGATSRAAPSSPPISPASSGPRPSRTTARAITGRSTTTRSRRGQGTIHLHVSSDNHPTGPTSPLPEASQREASRFPNTTTFAWTSRRASSTRDATFDRFGLHNMMKAGGTVTMYFDDLRSTARRRTPRRPGLDGAGNRITFEDREQVGAHDFGFSATTAHAGGAPGRSAAVCGGAATTATTPTASGRSTWSNGWRRAAR